MKILKIKRGFTTNSSSANEWMPAANQQQTQPTKIEVQTENLGVASGQGKISQISDATLSTLIFVGIGVFVGVILLVEKLIRALFSKKNEE